MLDETDMLRTDEVWLIERKDGTLFPSRYFDFQQAASQLLTGEKTVRFIRAEAVSEQMRIIESRDCTVGDANTAWETLEKLAGGE